MKDYRVNEIFYTVQSEGVHSGTASVFVRLQGCSVGCGWCDTKHTWNSTVEDERAKRQIILKEGDSNYWATMTTRDIMAECERLLNDSRSGHIVITGGEPFEQELSPLIKELSKKYTVQVETSGTAKIDKKSFEKAWITLSPKIGMKKPFLAESFNRCDEIKVPVGKRSDIDFLKDFDINNDIPIYLQPLSTSKKATEACMEICQQKGYKLSIQYHKFIGVR